MFSEKELIKSWKSIQENIKIKNPLKLTSNYYNSN